MVVPKKDLKDRQVGLFLAVRMYKVFPRFSEIAWGKFGKLRPGVT